MTVQIERTCGFDRVTFDIMVDIDDVMMPWAETVHLECGRLGLHDGSKPWSSWHMWEDYGCEKSQWEDAVISATARGLYTHTDPFPGAVEALNGLMWQGHRIHVVTARGFMENGTNIRSWTQEWLERYAIAHKSLTFAKDKLEAMHELGLVFDYAIDDGVHNYERLHQGGIPVWLHTQPHNVTHAAERRTPSVWEWAKLITSDAQTRALDTVSA